VKVEELFGRAQSNVKGRKIDLFFQKQLQGFDKPFELCSWEAKTTAVTSDQLQIQRRMNIRINACLTNKSLNIIDFAGSKDDSPHVGPIVLDIEGLKAPPYVLLKVKPGVFGAGAVTSPISMICLPQTENDIEGFLEEGSLSALLSIKVKLIL
jgi:hypothetical protein